MRGTANRDSACACNLTHMPTAVGMGGIVLSTPVRRHRLRSLSMSDCTARPHAGASAAETGRANQTKPRGLGNSRAAVMCPRSLPLRHFANALQRTERGLEPRQHCSIDGPCCIEIAVPDFALANRRCKSAAAAVDSLPKRAAMHAHHVRLEH